MQHALFRAGPFEVRDFTLCSGYLAHEGAISAGEAVRSLSLKMKAVSFLNQE
ncbi:hypothetical protein [Pelagibius sp.]|uniref:hypothetical protein n=1 Tax=Pelagibius sp. TaxID=1931238 RepID=UPI0026195F64|nr:hypothetical protein [Pelagibius sp.]